LEDYIKINIVILKKISKIFFYLIYLYYFISVKLLFLFLFDIFSMPRKFLIFLNIDLSNNKKEKIMLNYHISKKRCNLQLAQFKDSKNIFRTKKVNND
jgi:hypothetical protein